VAVEKSQCRHVTIYIYIYLKRNGKEIAKSYEKQHQKLLKRMHNSLQA